MLPRLQSPSARLALGVLALVVAVDILWLWQSPITFEWASCKRPVKTAGIALAASAASAAILRWLSGDHTRPARILQAITRGLANLGCLVAYMAVFTAAAAVLSYLAATVAWPLQDALLARTDRAMGFDWLPFLAWFNARPTIGLALSEAYHSSMNQVMALLVILSFLNRPKDAWDFAGLFAVTLTVVLAISAVLPASGAYVFYAPDPALYANLNADAGRWHYLDFLALRAGTFTGLSLDRLQGLVTFPSFHTVLAIITTYALRNLRLLFWPALLLNAAVILSTLTEGGHFLIDLPAGAVIACLAISLIRRISPERVADARPMLEWRPTPDQTQPEGPVSALVWPFRVSPHPRRHRGHRIQNLAR